MKNYPLNFKFLLVCVVLICLSSFQLAQALTLQQIIAGQQGEVLGASTPAFVQEANNIVFSGSSVSVTLNNITAHDALAAGVYWNQSPAVTLNSVSDSCSEPQAYTLLDNPTSDGGTAYGATAYNYNVTGGTCAITATFSSAVAEAKIWVNEISAILNTNPLDGHAAFLNAGGNTVCTDCLTSGAITTGQSGDYIFGYTFDSSSDGLTSGSNYTLRSSESSRGAIEDLIQSLAGSIAATFSRTDTTYGTNVAFVMAFKAVSGSSGSDTSTSAPTVPTGLTASAVSSSAINLSWTASTDNVGVVGYKIFRNSTQIATSATNSYSDSGLAASTQYSYTVSANDAAGNNSSQSSSASATTQAASSGSTVTALSCSQTDVQNAINNVTSGGTVIVPAGSCTYTTNSASAPSVNLNKSVIVEGQTVCTGRASTLSCADGTIITDHTGTGWQEDPFLITSSNARLTGFTITGGNSGDSFEAIGVAAGQSNVRIDHNKIALTASPITMRAIMFYGSTGLADYNYITTADGGVDVDGGVSGDVHPGDYNWSQPLNPGSSNCVYVEDNEFNFTSVLDGAWDSYDGARICFRYNDVQGTNTGSHGLDTSSGRSALLQEMYNNTFTNSGPATYSWEGSRGGTFFIFNNTVSAAGGSYNVYNDIREYREDSVYTWGLCNGSDSIDGNTPGQYGYPCQDQIGRGSPNASGFGTAEPLDPGYMWGNSWKGRTPTISDVNIANSSNCSNNCTPVTTYQILNNRDFFIEAANFNGSSGTGTGLLSGRPATCTLNVAYWTTDTNTLYKCSSANTWAVYYTPFTYPYPLTANGLPNPSAASSSPPSDTTPPAPPTGVSVN